MHKENMGQVLIGIISRERGEDDITIWWSHFGNLDGPIETHMARWLTHMEFQTLQFDSIK